MTCAQLIESLVGKRLCASSLDKIRAKDVFGDDIIEPKRLKKDPQTDGTPFCREFSLNKIVSELRSMGIEGFGKEMVTNGLTGEMMPTLVYYGVVFYQRLKHMVIDKVHARGKSGGRSALTRQPREGRARHGGLKVGIMEKDNLNAQGCSGFVRDRMLEQSNDYRTWVCSKCGTPVIAIKDGLVQPCALCESSDATQVRIPYSTKLLTQELMTANISLRMITKQYEDDKLEI